MAEIDTALDQTGEGEAGFQRVLYGRRMGRPLKPQRRALVDNLLPRVEIALADTAEPFVPDQAFEVPYEAYCLEIGFGAGEHLAWQARAHPNIGYIGCEPYLNGIARLLTDMETGDLGNIRICRDDARFLLSKLPEASLSRIFVLFPDPWPKSRHHKRRIVGPSVMPDLARVLSDGSELRIATDDPGYKSWILQHVLASGQFDWLARRPSDWRQRPEDWPPTRYEQKAISAGRCGAFFRFARRARVA